MVQLPLCDRVIPVIADEYVDREFGTGCVKITPAHDFNDYEVGRRHGLPMINIFNDNAAISDAAPAGLPRSRSVRGAPAGSRRHGTRWACSKKSMSTA